MNYLRPPQKSIMSTTTITIPQNYAGVVVVGLSTWLLYIVRSKWLPSAGRNLPISISGTGKLVLSIASWRKSHTPDVRSIVPSGSCSYVSNQAMRIPRR